MLRLAVIAIVLVACKDDSGTARKVSPAPAVTTGEPAPEPPGGPPRCTVVGAHLAGGLEMPGEVHATANGVDVSMSGDKMNAAMEDALVQACRDLAWSQETRACALAWTGNILRERARLAEACPGTVKK